MFLLPKNGSHQLVTYMDTLILYYLIQMTSLLFPNIMMRYMADCATLTRGASLPDAMFFTCIFKHFGVELEGEKAVEVTSIIEGRQVKPQALSRKSSRKTTAKEKGKAPFIDISDNEDDLEYMTKQFFRRRTRRHSLTKKKLKHNRHMLRQLTEELQTFTETQRRIVKLLAKELIKTDRELRICQEHWSLMHTQIGVSSSSEEHFDANSSFDSSLYF